MNFLRKLFPIKKNTITTTNIINTIETGIMANGTSHFDHNSNVLEINSTLNNCEGETNIDIAVNHISEDNINELDSDKTFHILTNVSPAELSPNIDISDIITDKSAEKVNETVGPINLISEDLEDGLRTGQNAVNTDKDIQIVESNNSPNLIDEVDLQIKEFDEVFINIDDLLAIGTLGTQCSLNSTELDDILNELETANAALAKENNNNSNSGEMNANNNVNDDKVAIKNEMSDVISINSSTEENVPQNGDDNKIITLISDSDGSASCDGYHSSDFEFISEAEAKMDGFIINFRPNEPSDNLEQFDGCHAQFAQELFGEDGYSDPGEGSSTQNRSKNEFQDRSYRDHHHIPEGDNFLELFQGIYNPLMAISEIYFLENKSVRTSAMNSQYDGMGFDKQLALRRHQPDSSEDEFADDAKETASKILNMYPRENRKRRRRR